MHALQRFTSPLPGFAPFKSEVKQIRRFQCRKILVATCSAAQPVVDSDRRPRDWGQSVPISAVVYQGSRGNPQAMREIYFATGNQNKLKEVSQQVAAVVLRHGWC